MRWAYFTLFIALFTYLFWSRLFPLDDAYITLSNARTMLSGQLDPVYQTPYLTGATSTVHLLLVALLMLFIPPIWAPLVLGLCGAVLYYFALVTITERTGLIGWRKQFLVIGGMVCAYLPFHYLNGLETSLAVAASAWMFLWSDDRRRLPILAGLAPFLRPELGLFSLLLLLRLVFRSNSRQIAYIVASAALAALPWAIWTFAEVGAFIPSTIAAKLAWFHPQPLSLIIRAAATLHFLMVALQLPLFIGLAGLPRLPGGCAATAFVALGILVSAAVMPDIVDWNFGRYDAIYVPLLVAGIAALATDRTRVINSIVLAFFIWSLASAALAMTAYLRETELARRVEAQAKFVAQLPASSIVLIHDAGQVAWQAPKAKLVDVVGLKTPAIVPINRKLIRGNCERQKALDAIAHRYSATHLVVLNRWAWPCIAVDLRRAGWMLRPIYSNLYTVYEITPPDKRG